MEIKIIKTEKEYNQALKYLEALGDREDFGANEKLLEEFELLSTIIGLYDKEHYSLQKADPIEIIKLRMEYKGLKRKDLISIASSGVLSEVFNKKRGLSKQMIREFAKLLAIDQDLLNTPYELKEANNSKERVHIKSPFKFIRLNQTAIDRFKKRITENYMLLNVRCTS